MLLIHTVHISGGVEGSGTRGIGRVVHQGGASRLAAFPRTDRQAFLLELPRKVPSRANPLKYPSGIRHVTVLQSLYLSVVSTSECNICEIEVEFRLVNIYLKP